MAPSIIGLTAVALGTSLPELTTDVIGVLKGEEKLVLGETLGSNIFNMLLIGGVASLFSPLYFVNMVGIAALLGFTFLLTALIYFHKGKYIRKSWGVVLFLGYAVYLWFLLK